LLSIVFVSEPLRADAAALEWDEVETPATVNNIVVSPSEVSNIGVGRNSVLYAIDSENSGVYRSLDAGLSWEDISFALSKAGAELPASKIAVAPDNEGIVAVVTDGASAAYVSLDGGMSWDDTNVPALTGNIQTLAISPKYTEGGKPCREIAIGTAEWGDESTTGQLWVLQGGSMWASWDSQDLAIDPSYIGAEISALAYSPDYQHDRTLVIVASTAGDVSASYRYRTWLCLGERDAGDGDMSWDSFDGYPLEIAAAGDAADVARMNSSLALPSDYSSEDESSRRLFISYDREPDAGDDVYLIDEDIPYRLDTNGGADINLASISYHGTTDSGTLLAGDADPVAGSLTVQVRRTGEPFDRYPEWEPASVPPTGPGNARVSWNPDGTIAYCVTSQSPGEALDESAVSASLDGDAWRQMGLIDTAFQVADIAVTPDSEFLFVTSSSTFGPEGVWRSFSDPLGKSWERVLAMDTDTNAVILRLSPDYDDDHTLYAAEVGGEQIAVSHNRGRTWNWCRRPPGLVVDLAVVDEDTIYVALRGGDIVKNSDGGRRWDDPVETGLIDINMLAVVDDNTMLVGGRNGDVAYSTDGGESFIEISELLGSGEGDVQVVADADFSENSIIYAATNLADEGLWRWTIGVSDEWEQLDEAITRLKQGQRISGLAVGPEGTLYALRLEPVSTTTGGMTRWLYPCPSGTDFEYDFINFSLPADAAFDPTVLFPNTVSYIELSWDSDETQVWSIDTTEQRIYRFRDTLCKRGPDLELPEYGAVIPPGPCPCDSPSNLILDWEDLSDVTEYQIAVYLDGDSTIRVWSRHSSNNDIIATSGDTPLPLSSCTAYYWKVRAEQPVKSPWSEMSSFGVAPVKISGLCPAPGATGVSLRPVFTWDSAGQDISFEFVLARDSQFSDVLVSITGTDALISTSWSWDRELDYSTIYFWKVRPVSPSSQGEWITGVFTTEAAPETPEPGVQTLVTPQVAPSPISSIPSYLLCLMVGIGIAIVVSLLVLIARTGR
jgi:hypothetical protein